MIIRPATPLDLADLLAGCRFAISEPAYKLLLRQVAGKAWAGFSSPATPPATAGAPLVVPEALAGIYGDGSRPSVVWFLVSPSIGSKLAALVIRGRELLREQAPLHPEGLVAGVVPGNRAGERLAVALGFQATGVIACRQQVWLYGAPSVGGAVGGEADEQIRGRSVRGR